MKPAPWSGWRPALAVALLAMLLLAVVSARHPGLRLVDFLGFSTRGHRLLAGEDLVHPLYPIGYPAILGVLQHAQLPPITAGRVLSIAAGGLAAAIVTRWWGAVAALWLVVQPVFLTYGSTEGTDLAAFSLGLAALWARCGDRPGLAGTLAGLATLTRYTSAALLPIVLLPPLGDQRKRRSTARTLAAFAITTSPHWLVALATGAPVLPDQSGNFAIGANAAVQSLGWDALVRLPGGLVSAAPFIFGGPGVGIGLLGLLAGATWAWRRRDTASAGPALRLLGWGAIHWGLVATAFANARLVLPTRLCFALGIGIVLRHRPRILLPVSLAMAVWTLPPAWSTSPSAVRLAEVVEVLETLDGPLRTGHFLTSDPWVHRQSGQYLQTGTPLRELGGDPRLIDGSALVTYARLRGFTLVVLDAGRLSRTYPGLMHLFKAPDHAETVGLSPIARVPGYRVYAVVPEESP